MSERILEIYDDVRSQIRSGDLLLFRPHKDPASLAIAAGGRSEYSHAALAAWWDETLMLLEMSFGGGRAVTLSSQVELAPGCWDVFQTNPQRVKGFCKKKAVENMIRAMGTPYGWGNLWYLVWRKLPIVRLFARPVSDDRQNGSPMICSQAVSRACRWAGFDPVPELADSMTEPGDLARSPFFRYRFTLLASLNQKGPTP